MSAVTELGQPHRVLVIATDAVDGVELAERIREGRPAGEIEAAVVAPVVEHNPVKHMAGDLEPARERAEERLRDRIGELEQQGLRARGTVGDTDPLLAAEDVLSGFEADEVLIFERADEGSRWFEDDLFDRARERLEPPIRMVTVESDAGEARLGDEQRAGTGTVDAVEREEVSMSPYLPGFERGDVAAVAIGIFGTIVAIVFFAAGPINDRPEAPAAAVASGVIALAAGLINLAHVIGLTLFESVRYRGFFRGFFRNLTLVYTPLAALANFVIWLVT